MKLSALLVLSVLLMPLALAVAQAGADPAGDDLVVCCDVQPPPTGATLAPVCGLVQSCVPIDGTTASINRCAGIVMGCAESAFLCLPSSVTKGKQDCTCAALSRLLCAAD